jgi:hypothetical protein
MSEPNPDRGLVVHTGPIEVDIPRSLGYYGGIALAVGVGIIEPPLAVFIGAIPIVKMLMHGNAPQPLRFLGQIFDGAAQPVGGDAEGTIRVEDDDSSHETRERRRPTSASKSDGAQPARTGIAATPRSQAARTRARVGAGPATA